MTPAERTELCALAERVRRIPAYSRMRPHCFVEDKSEIAHDIERLATLNAEPVRQPDRDPKVSFGKAMRRTVTAGRGALVVVERRGRPAPKRP